MGALLLLAAALFTGCMQIDVTVAMHDKDDGATITERIRLTRQLLEVCPTDEKKKELLAHLTREAALKRMKQMGKGVTLESHNQKKLPNGSIQSITVFKIPKIKNLILCNPLIHAHPAGAGAGIGYGLFRTGNKRLDKKQINVSVNTRNRKKKYPSAMTRRTKTPLDRQILRELKPIISDMVSDFQVRIRLKVPTRFTARYVRNIKAAPKVTTLFSLSGKDLDRRGNNFFENEEILLAMLELDFKSHVLLKNTGSFTNNSRSPVLRAHGNGLYHPNRFRIMPTAFHKKKYNMGQPAKSKKDK